MRILREPLFHFFLLGLAIFGWFAWTSPPEAESAPLGVIIIDSQDVARQVEQFRATWQRAPNPDELDAMVESMVREEVFVREAETLGLDRGDQVIRNRLVQKMTFLTNSVAQSMEPDDATLTEYLEANPENFRIPGRIAFEQVALGTAPSAEAVAEVREALRAGAAPDSVGTVGLLPANLPLSSLRKVDSTFGRGFFDGIAGLEGNDWQGPVSSGYGAHLVRITAREPERLPQLDEIRDLVVADWRRETSYTLSEAQYEVLKAQYEVVLPEETQP